MAYPLNKESSFISFSETSLKIEIRLDLIILMLEVITAQMFTGARVSECINHINDKDIKEHYIMVQKGKTKGARR